MYQEQQQSITCFISIFFLIFNILISPLSSAYVDELYASCAPVNSTCGPSLEVKYPFRYSSHPNQCGYPGFDLECQGDSLTIQIKNETYNVLDINYDSNTFNISKPHFSEGPCPQTQSQLTNTTLDLTLFNFTSSSENLALFYSCEKTPDGSASLFGFVCPENSYTVSNSDVFISSLNFIALDEKLKVELRKQCSIAIYIPVFKKQVDDLEKGYVNISDVLSKGFGLKWTTIDESQCKDCEESRGRCGYDSTLGQPICLCQYGASNTTCIQSKLSNAFVSIAPSHSGNAILPMLLFFLIVSIIFSA